MGVFIVFFVIWSAIAAVGVGSFVFWVVKAVEVARTPEAQFRAAGSEKANWILIVLLAGIAGAVIWQLSMRDRVRAAIGAAPGWYADQNGTQRWWDGARWTEHAQPTHGVQQRS